MALQVHNPIVEIVWIDQDEEISFFNHQVETLLGMSGQDFTQRLATGEFRERIDDPDCPDYMYLALLSASAK